MKSDSSHPGSSFDGIDPVDRAVEGLRAVAIEEGPSPMLVARTQAAIRGEAEVPGPAGRPQISNWKFAFRIAAVIAIVCGSAAACIVLLRRAHTVPLASDTRPGEHPNSVNPHPSPAVQPTVAAAPPKFLDVQPVLIASTIPDGTIAGRVIFDGPAPPRTLIEEANLMPGCVARHGGPIYDESMVVAKDGALANVVISVSDGLSGWLSGEFPPPTETAILDQRGCAFEPHVVAIMVGQQLLIKNSDPFLHNVHMLAVNNPPSNLGQPTVGQALSAPFESPEVFRVKCDVHGWMSAWVRVVDNPFFAVTGPTGRFTLRGLPPGVYTLKAWHEQLGTREQQVTITPGQGAQMDFTFRRGPAAKFE